MSKDKGDDDVEMSMRSSYPGGYTAVNPEEEGFIAKQYCDTAADDPDNKKAEIFNLDDESTTKEKVGMIVSCALPISFTAFLGTIGGSIMMFHAGQLSKLNNDLDVFTGVSLAVTYCNISFLSIMEGFSSAVETLSSNHNGSKNYSAVGETLHKSILSLVLVGTPLLCTWFFADHIFRTMGVDPRLSYIAERFLMARIFASPVEIGMMSYVKYLQSMGLMNPGMYAGICYNSLLVVSCSVCVHVLELSYESLAWCHVISTFVQFLFLVLITYDKKEVQRTMVRPTLQNILDVSNFLAYGFAGCVMMCAVWWAFELLTVFAAMVSTEALSAQTILIQAVMFLSPFPIGISVSTGSIVGNALGANYKNLAISIGQLAMVVIFVIDMFLCPIVLCFRQDFVELFTSDPVVIRICVDQCIPILAFETFFHGMKAVTSGVLRGAGKQNVGAKINIVAYYVIALPLAWYLCFNKELGVVGLVVGVCMGTLTQTSMLLVMVLCHADYVYEGVLQDLSNNEECCEL